MKTVRTILQNKGKDIWHISPEASVYEALQLMAKKEIGAVLVIKDEIIVGIMSERDYARKVILKGKYSKEIMVKEIMSTKVIYVNTTLSVEECMALMINKRIRHLPVIENGKLVGIISIGDVVKAVIEDKEFLIEQLVHYITGVPS
ncbi:MAG: CBS domain-containing protein [Bacteroidetes bacterium]|nr:CBS domain-containing protein [Bacteroidota bacterium]